MLLPSSGGSDVVGYQHFGGALCLHAQVMMWQDTNILEDHAASMLR